MMNERMMTYLPEYERKSGLIIAMVNAIAAELEQQGILIEQVGNEFLIDTAETVLALHERDLGITAAGLTVQQRRELIQARYRATMEQTIETSIKSVVSAFTNSDVEIRTTVTPGVFEMKFISLLGVPSNLDGVKQTVDIILPAHLEMTYTFSYNTWAQMDAKNLTWNSINGLAKTWEQMEVYS